MSRFRLGGLDGRNPLHFLAALGLLRLGDRIRPGMRLGWSFQGAVRNPVVEPIQDLADLQRLAGTMAQWLRELGKEAAVDASVDSELREVRGRIKEITKERGLSKEAREEIHRDRILPLEQRLQEALEKQRDLQRRKASALGSGVAHLGDRIGVAKDNLRALGEGVLQRWIDATREGRRDARPVTDDPWLVVAELPALASEVLTDGGNLEPTPFSFGNGASGQNLLKDFRELTSCVEEQRLIACMAGEPEDERYLEDGRSLNWDPSDYRPHSQNARDPQDMPKRVDVGANLLAYLGLGFLTVVPVGIGRALTLGDATVGPTERNHALKWPLWETPLPVDVVSALFAHRLVTSSGRVLAGVREVWKAEVFRPDGKRPFFRPAHLLATA